MLTLNVRGLERAMTEDALRQLFAPYGRVFDLRFARDLFTGESRGFAELKMEGHEARSAIEALNGSLQGTTTIRVAVHDPKHHQRRSRR